MATNIDTVTQLYVAYFNRPADPAGLAFWTNVLANGGSAADISASFSTSPEYVKAYAGLTSYQIVNQVYMNLFGHTPDAGGLKFYATELDNKVSSVSNIVAEIAGGAQGTDLVAFNEKVDAAEQFTTALNDNPAAAIAYTGAAANAIGAAYLAGVKDVASHDAAVAPANLASLGTAIIATGTPAAVTFALTSGVDTQTASVFNGVLSSTPANNTLNSFDTLTGSGGSTTNVLNLVSDGVTAVPAGVTLNNIQTVNINSIADQSINSTTWTGVKALNITNVGVTTAADTTITAAAGTAVTVTGDVIGVGAGLAVNGGTAVSLSASGTTSAGAIGNILVGGVAKPAGAVVVNATESATAAAATFGSITINGGTDVTVNSTDTATVGATVAGIITVAGATGAVTVNNNTVIGQATGAVTGDTVKVTGGTTVTVNEVITATAGAKAGAAAGTATDGAVTVLDGGTATSVTINQTVATGRAGTAAVAAVAATVTPGGPGFSEVNHAATAAVAAVAGTNAVAAGQVIVAGANASHAASDASTTITDVTLAGFGAGSYINSAVLSSVTLSGRGSDLTIDNASTTPLTSLSLNLNGFRDTAAISEANVKTLNVTTGGTSASTLAAFTDTALTTLNIAGSQTFALGTVNTTLKTIAVTGDAGFSGNVSALGAGLTSFTTDSTGTITATLDAAHQTFVGASGQDIITITADATKVITGGSATNNELILTGAATTYIGGSTKTVANVTGFTTLGVSSGSGNFDLGLLTGFNAIDVQSTTAATSFTGVTAGTTLSLDASTTTAVSYTLADATGATDALALNLGTATTNTLVTSELDLADANAVGIATLNVVTNDDGTGAAATITTLVDNGLANLNVSGTTGLTITTLNEATTQATTFNIANTSDGDVTITNFTDANLGSITFSGTGDAHIANLLGVTGHILAISNTGTGAATIDTFADANLTSLTLSGAVALGADGSGAAAATATGATSGVTLAAGTDDAHINFSLTGAVAGATDKITVGNGNDFISDLSTGGNVQVTVGTGSNIIDVSHGTGAGSFSITLGAHTGVDSIFVSEIGTTAAATAVNTVITGAVANDVINFTDGAALNIVAVSDTNAAALTAAASLQAAVTLAHTLTTAHGVVAFNYGGNTYLVEDVAATTAAATSSVVELVGTHTVAAGTGNVHLVS